ncbi:LysR substrate-binding domain-containing protein [Isoptericola aurantiacus]|uniref:LysR substrate-binding domain-containing protein n=1 Tax=Isoptericola aurantiacus TaxID=3377839 RepID=UPI003839E37A
MSDDTPPAPGPDGPGPDDGAPAEDTGPRFRLAYVPGATPGRWARTWEQRLRDVPLDLVPVPAADVATALRAGDVDAAIGRLPVDKDVFHAIELYTEVPVVVVSRDHLLAATEESEHLTAADLDEADDVTWLPADDVLFTDGRPVPGRAPTSPDPELADGLRPRTTAEAVEWAATGVGMVVVPMSLARLHHRKDVVHRVLDGGPEAPVGLVWLRDGLSAETAVLVEEMVGIVRGRTVNSSRGRGGAEGATAGGPTEPRGRGAGGGRAGRPPAEERRSGRGRGGTTGRGGRPGKGSSGRGGRTGGRGRR